MTSVITALSTKDWPQIRAIYEDGIRGRLATFETEVPNWEEWNKKYLKICRLGIRKGATLLGWATLSPVSMRKVYRGVAEVSIYIAANAQGKKLGSCLMQRLINESEKAGIWMLQSSVFPHNPASMRLHEKTGFRKVGYRERIAQLDGVWLDTILFERRVIHSETISSDKGF